MLNFVDPRTGRGSARIKGDNHEGHERTRRTWCQLECCREEIHTGCVRKGAMKTASLADAHCAGEMNRRLSGAEKFRSQFLRVSSGIAAVMISLALATGCSSEPEKPAEPAKPEVKGPELLTARSAFQKTYVAARGWSQDSKPYRIESVVTSDANGGDGKWAAWRAGFGSPTQRAAKIFIWSGMVVMSTTSVASRWKRLSVPFGDSVSNARVGIWCAVK